MKLFEWTLNFINLINFHFQGPWMCIYCWVWLWGIRYDNISQCIYLALLQFVWCILGLKLKIWLCLAHTLVYNYSLFIVFMNRNRKWDKSHKCVQCWYTVSVVIFPYGYSLWLFCVLSLTLPSLTKEGFLNMIGLFCTKIHMVYVCSEGLVVGIWT